MQIDRKQELNIPDQVNVFDPKSKMSTLASDLIAILCKYQPDYI